MKPLRIFAEDIAALAGFDFAPFTFSPLVGLFIRIG